MRKIAIQFGLWMFFGFTALFLVMDLIGLSDQTYLRSLNGIIHIGLIWGAIRKYRQWRPESTGNYLSGVAVGIWASAIGVIGFVLFLTLFFAFDPAFLESVQHTIILKKYLTPVTAPLFILAEGLAISLIGSYIVVRLVDIKDRSV